MSAKDVALLERLATDSEFAETFKAAMNVAKEADAEIATLQARIAALEEVLERAKALADHWKNGPISADWPNLNHADELLSALEAEPQTIGSAVRAAYGEAESAE